VNNAHEIIVRGLANDDVHVVIEPGPQAASASVDRAVEHAWEELRQANTRLHDGPIMLADATRLARGELVCRHGSYKELATAVVLRRSVRALGVCGVVVGRDGRGHEHVLFGRRSGETRVYGGMWENAPSGTVAPPRAGMQSLGLEQLSHVLRTEGIEELGLELVSTNVRAIATLEDSHARSVDVVLRVEVGGVIERRETMCASGACGRWEYVDAAWVEVGEIALWMNGGGLSSPTVALMRWCGWG